MPERKVVELTLLVDTEKETKDLVSMLKHAIQEDNIIKTTGMYPSWKHCLEEKLGED